jgi:hypothetical protein
LVWRETGATKRPSEPRLSGVHLEEAQWNKGAKPNFLDLWIMKATVGISNIIVLALEVSIRHFEPAKILVSQASIDSVRKVWFSNLERTA